MNGWKHTAIVTVIIAVLSVFTVYAFLNTSLVPFPAADQAGPIDRIIRIGFAAGGVIFLLVMVFLIYTAIVFRRPRGDTEEGPPEEGIPILEFVWTFIPLAIVIWLSFLGAQVLAEISQQQPEELEVKVVGFQWAWRFEYPQFGITTNNDLRLPVNRPVFFRITSLDVIHSFWVPEFRIKQDAVPGVEHPLRITPNNPGNFRALCAELCGLAHAQMVANVTVMEQADFDNWVMEQRR